MRCATLAALLCALPAWGQDLSRPTSACEPPESLSSPTRATLNATATALSAREDALGRTIDAHQQQCRGLRGDQPALITRCEQSRARIEPTWQQYEADVAAYAAAVRRALDTERADLAQQVAAATKRRAATRNALQQYRDKLPDLTAELEEWAELSENARTEASDKALGIVASLTLDKLLRTKRDQARLTQAQLESVTRQLAALEFPPHTRAYLYDNPALQLWRVTLLDKRVTLQVQLPAQATDLAVLQALRDLKQVTGVMEAERRLTQQESTAVLKAILPVLQMFVKDPVGKLLIADVELGTNLAYLGLARALSGARIRQLEALTEQQLRAIRTLGLQYERDVKEQGRLEIQMEQRERDRQAVGTGGCLR